MVLMPEPPTDAYRLTDHWWWRPGWRVGSRYYALHLLLDDQPTLVQLAQRYQSVLAGFDALDPIPEPWLHITLQGVGHIEDLTGAELDRTFQAVGRRAAALRPEPLEFRRATIFGEGVVLVPSDPTPLAEVYEGIRAGIAEARDASAVADSDHTFVPHVTVAYANRAAATAPIRTALDAVTPAGAVSIRFRRLSLIMMHRDRRIYEWVELGTVALHS